jgi:hypothetical protein
MKLGAVTQQPAERMSYSFQYQEALDAGETLSEATFSVDPTGELVVESTVTLPTHLQFWVTGGVDRRRYKVTATVTTSSGRVFQDELLISIRDI